VRIGLRRLTSRCMAALAWVLTEVALGLKKTLARR